MLLPLLLLPLLLLLLLPLMGLPTRFFSSKVLEIRKAIELKLDRLGPSYMYTVGPFPNGSYTNLLNL